MTRALIADVPLYRRILGGSWDKVAASVRRFHDVTTTLRAAGTFRVRHGASRLARLIIWLNSMPVAGDSVPVELLVTRRGDSEEWARRFAGRPMESVQAYRAGGTLAEVMGPSEIRFRLAVEDGALLYRWERTALRLGFIRIPLPRWLAPQTSARERPGPRGDDIETCVEVTLPLLGLLIAYDGTVAICEGPG